MFLSEIAIRNFRNLEDVTVSLRRGLNVLVGANNAGKTNLFDAIRHALGPFSNRSEMLWLNEDDICSSSEDRQISISLTFSGLDDSDRSQFFEIVDFGATQKVEDASARINFEATWNVKTKKFRHDRWGGSREGERSQIPSEILEAIPLTFLPALRDAESALSPGNRSVLAKVLQQLSSASDEEEFETIISGANDEIEETNLVDGFQKKLRGGVRSIAGTDYLPASVSTSPPSFAKILRSLRLILADAPVKKLVRSGMGYNNILYISTILSYLSGETQHESPILLVEEPEAHLNPQLTVLLGEHLASLDLPQTLVSTHSPTFAANVRPSQVLMIHKEEEKTSCRSIAATGMTDKEERQLQRMLDITRATLYFAKGLILVEGISEALLIPQFAKLLAKPLEQRHISILPVCGVNFGVFGKLFSKDGLRIPVAIITDADPPVDTPKDGTWRDHTPRIGETCDRLKCLLQTFKDNNLVGIRNSKVTLEYDLALAGSDNASIMAEVWEQCFTGTPGTLNQSSIDDTKSSEENALTVWRGICRADNSGSKAEFAHILAEKLEATGTKEKRRFEVPGYIQEALSFVLDRVPSLEEDEEDEKTQ